ncbi:hypothetical protein RAM_42655 [Amycolatopsis mediterranei S699]|uniref:Uncharacterized protein n=1 Tax=Amycolatopsis mediterranei (strain S699) TaxID=713604 RepID=A0A9R0P618_AMYMS|nr:hypothetical protein RAM_42655 [Amycolatopsis mediterranei S699]
MLLPQQRCRRQSNGLWNDDIGLWCRFVRARPQSFRRNTLNVCVKPDVPDRGSVGRITDWWQSQEDATAERVDHEVGLHLRYLRWHTDVRRCNLSAFVEFEGLEAESFGQLHIEAVAAGRYCIKQIENSISDIGCELAAVAQETFDRLVHVVEVTIRRPRGDPCQQLRRCQPRRRRPTIGDQPEVVLQTVGRNTAVQQHPAHVSLPRFIALCDESRHPKSLEVAQERSTPFRVERLANVAIEERSKVRPKTCVVISFGSDERGGHDMHGRPPS